MAASDPSSDARPLFLVPEQNSAKMNADWKNFLASRGFTGDLVTQIEFNKTPDFDRPWICPLAGMGIIEFSGNDAAVFLQGQVTCDVNILTEGQSSLGAYCNPKGRVITEFRMLKVDSTYYWLLSAELIPSVTKRLKMFILRSDVCIRDLTDTQCLMGISAPPGELAALGSQEVNYPTKSGAVVALRDTLIIKPSSFSGRLMLIAPRETAKGIWHDLADSNQFEEADWSYWERMAIRDGIPRIVTETSEKFIPQMLNLDELDAISFQKGCYTGQEIVARTHYLGKLKRRMFMARCKSKEKLQPNAPVFDLQDDSDQNVGNIVNTTMHPLQFGELLVVLIIGNAESNQLRIGSRDGEKIEILSLPYNVTN